MVAHIPGLIASAAVAGITAIGMLIALLVVDTNKGQRRNVIQLALILSGLYLAISVGRFNIEPSTTLRRDGVPVDITRGVFNTALLTVLVLVYAVFCGVDHGVIIMLILKALLLGSVFTAGLYASWNYGYAWFVFGFAIYICLAAVKFRLMRRPADGYYFSSLVLGSIAGLGMGLGWLFGPQLIGAFDESIQFTIYQIAEGVLYLLLPAIMVLMQGEEDSFYKSIKKEVREKVDGILE